MSDFPQAPPAPKPPRGIMIEWTDALAAVGALATVGGAFLIHPGLATMTVGTGCLVLAWRLAA